MKQLFIFEFSNPLLIIMTPADYEKKEQREALIKKYFKHPKVQRVEISTPLLEQKLNDLRDKGGERVGGTFNYTIKSGVTPEEQDALLNNRSMPYRKVLTT